MVYNGICPWFLCYGNVIKTKLSRILWRDNLSKGSEKEIKNALSFRRSVTWQDLTFYEWYTERRNMTSIRNNCKLLLNYWHRVLNITSSLKVLKVIYTMGIWKILNIRMLYKMTSYIIRSYSKLKLKFRAVSLKVFYLHFCQNWDIRIVRIVRTRSVSSYALKLNQK